MPWIVEIRTSSPDDQDVGQWTFAVRRCLDFLGSSGVSATCDPDGWVIGIEIEAADMQEARTRGIRGIFHAALEGGLPLWRIIALRVTLAEYFAAMV
jgi:hypothetical protein